MNTKGNEKQLWHI